MTTPKPKLPPTPELDKIREISDRTQIIGEFLDSTKYVLCTLVNCTRNYHGENSEAWYACEDDYHMVPVDKPIERMLAEAFNIDLMKVEQERRALLRYLEEQNREK